jgi:ribonuclease R
MEVEREVVDIYRAYFMRDRIGDVLDGTISGVVGFGLFVVIDHPFVEGLVRVEALSDDYYVFDESRAALIGRRSGRAFALGDELKVVVQSVSVVRRKIDFALEERMAGAMRPRRTTRQRGHGGGHGADRGGAHPGGPPASGSMRHSRRDRPRIPVGGARRPGAHERHDEGGGHGHGGTEHGGTGHEDERATRRGRQAKGALPGERRRKGEAGGKPKRAGARKASTTGRGAKPKAKPKPKRRR